MFKSTTQQSQHQQSQPQPTNQPSLQQLTPNSSSSPYTITSSLSSSSCSIPPPVPSLLTQPKKNSLTSIKSFDSLRSIHSVKSTCKSQRCFISIWSTWYCLLIIGLHIYLIKNRISDLVNLFTINSDSFNWSNLTLSSPLNTTITMSQLNSSLYFEIITRLCMLILSISFLLLFLVCSLKPFGNYSNDAVKFGRDFFNEKIKHSHLKRKKNKSNSCFKSLFQIIWRHFLPVSSFCHLISILLLIFSRIIYDDSTRTLVNYTTIKECLSNKLLVNPCLLNYYLNQVNQTLSQFVTLDETNTFYLTKELIDFKFELISICLAFVSIYIRYGSVFWFTNKCLSFLITFIGFIASIEQLFQMYSFIYFYNQLNLNENIYWTSFYSKSNETLIEMSNSTSLALHSDTHNNGFLGTFVASFEITFLIRNKFSLFFLYFTLSVLVYLSATPAYVFSFLKYKERFIIEEALFIRSIAIKSNNNKKGDDFSTSSSSTITNENTKLPVYDKKLHLQTELQVNSTCCFNYCPHLIATIQLVLICACKLPFCYDYVIYYNKFKDFGIFFVIIIEILHTIILIFIWLLLTLKTEWNMHLQTSFTICHWTYHMKRKQCEDQSKNQNFNKIKTITGSELGNIETKKSFESGQNPVDFTDLKNSRPDKPFNNYDENHLSRPTTLLTYQDNKSQNSIVIRNNNNSNNTHKANNKNYGNPRQHLETKHKSMIERYEDHIFRDNIYSTNINDCKSQILPATSDYLLNSETLYRNEIRKSIRNIMQQKRCSNSALIGSSATLVTASSMAHLINQQQQKQQKQNSETKEPFYYKSETGKKRLVGGLYLTSTTPTVIDNSTVKVPHITHIVTSTVCSSSNSSTSASIPTQHADQPTSQANKNRAVLYLERRPSSSNEYESRV